MSAHARRAAETAAGAAPYHGHYMTRSVRGVHKRPCLTHWACPSRALAGGGSGGERPRSAEACASPRPARPASGSAAGSGSGSAAGSGRGRASSGAPRVGPVSFMGDGPRVTRSGFQEPIDLVSDDDADAWLEAKESPPPSAAARPPAGQAAATPGRAPARPSGKENRGGGNSGGGGSGRSGAQAPPNGGKASGALVPRAQGLSKAGGGRAFKQTTLGFCKRPRVSDSPLGALAQR
jgi:hypothetical protein